MSEAKNEEFDEVDELLIAEGVLTKEDIREAEEWAEEVDVEELIEAAEPIPEDGSASGTTDKSDG